MRYLDRNEGFELFLAGLNEAVASLPPPDVPQQVPGSLQITGLPRSGTTLLYQLLARSGAVGYPSNVMAMFHGVPWVGARLQVQLAAAEPTISSRSTAGRTPEPLDPHEFGYFWRRVCGHSSNSLRQDLRPLPPEALQQELDLVASVFGRPVVYKNFLALAHGSRMLAELERMHLVVVRRPLRDVAASLFQLRRRLGTPSDAPLGVQPEEPGPGVTVEDRVAWQVTRLAARMDALLVSDAGVKGVSYRDLCHRPREVVTQVLEGLGRPMERADVIPRELQPGAGFAGLDPDDQKLLARALERASEETERRG